MPENARDTFIQELDREIAWQWRWEKLNRRLNTTAILANSFSSFSILVLSFYQLQVAPDLHRWVILSITVLAFVNVGLPVLSTAMRFQQKQEVYDRMARTYGFIRIQVLTEQISLERAISTFGEVHCKPTEKVIRQTP